MKYWLLFFREFHHFLAMNHIIAISTRVSIEYINIGDIEELVMIGAVAGKDTASVPPTEIIWDKGLEVERVPSGPS